MRTSSIAMILALAVAAPTAAHAGPAEPNDELSIGGVTRSLRSASANALTDDSLGGTALGYAREVAVLGPGLAVWAEAGLAIDHARGTMFQTMTTELDVIGLTGGLRVRDRLHRLVAASARVDAGAQRLDVEIGAASGPARGHAWGAMAQAALAVDVLVVARPRFALGVRVELGYVVAQAPALALRGDVDDDVLQLAMTEAALGHLNLSGATFGASLVGQF